MLAGNSVYVASDLQMDTNAMWNLHMALRDEKEFEVISRVHRGGSQLRVVYYSNQGRRIGYDGYFVESAPCDREPDYIRLLKAWYAKKRFVVGQERIEVVTVGRVWESGEWCPNQGLVFARHRIALGQSSDNYPVLICGVSTHRDLRIGFGYKSQRVPREQSMLPFVSVFVSACERV